MTKTPDWSAYAKGAIIEEFADAWITGAARTPFVDYNGALGLVSPTDLGIHAARAALARSSLDPRRLGTTIAGCCAQASFDALFFARHIGLYAGMSDDKPALGVHRLCTTGFEAIAQAARGVSAGHYEAALSVGTESMTRTPVAAYTHRGGFRLGQVEFKDFLWEALFDTAGPCAMGDTAENLAKAYGIDRAGADAYAARSFARALAAVEAGKFAEEIAPVVNAEFTAEGLKPRSLKLPRNVKEVAADTHIRPTPLEVLAKIPPAFGGVQTGGNSSAIVDGAAAVVVTNGALARQGKPLGRVLAAATAGVPAQVMGIGPVPAAQALLQKRGMSIGDIDLVEVNEAFAAQVESVRRALGVAEDRFNVNGGPSPSAIPWAPPACAACSRR
jgi:acetyl-CoA C-acetyltransferase